MTSGIVARDRERTRWAATVGGALWGSGDEARPSMNRDGQKVASSQERRLKTWPVRTTRHGWRKFALFGYAFEMVRSASEIAAREAAARLRIGEQVSHLWSDALAAREHARQADVDAAKVSVPGTGLAVARDEARAAEAEWDRGAFVRWAVITACTALERACCDAFGTEIHHFADGLKSEFRKRGHTLDTKVPPWDEVWRVRERRHAFIHRDCSPTDLRAAASEADASIVAMRAGILDAYRVAGKKPPLWVECDRVPRVPTGSSGWLSARSAAALTDPERYRIVAVFGKREFVSAELGSTEDPWPRVEALLCKVRVPLSAVRIYKGEALFDEIDVGMRGAP